MANFVLVGGAWVGAWIWRDVTRLLRARGHEAYPITLSGLADRVHLANPSIDLDTHITDVVNTLVYEDLSEVVLVGHSYAGGVVTGVADRCPERLSVLLFCDSAPLAAGQSMLDFSPPDAQAQLRTQVAEHGRGWLMPPPPWAPEAGASLRGLSEADLALLRRKATPQPFGTYTQPLQLTTHAAPTYRRGMVLCDDGKRIMALARASLAAGEGYFRAVAGDDWQYAELETGHWPMLSAPVELSDALETLATASFEPASAP